MCILIEPTSEIYKLKMVRNRYSVLISLFTIVFLMYFRDESMWVVDYTIMKIFLFMFIIMISIQTKIGLMSKKVALYDNLQKIALQENKTITDIDSKIDILLRKTSIYKACIISDVLVKYSLYIVIFFCTLSLLQIFKMI